MEHDQINATIDANNAAVAAGDMDAILATFEPNCALVGEPGMLAQGTSALRDAFTQFIGMSPQISVTNHEIIQATWKMSGKAPDGSEFEQTGFSVVVLRKQPDGRWLMVIDNPFGDHLVKSS